MRERERDRERPRVCVLFLGLVEIVCAEIRRTNTVELSAHDLQSCRRHRPTDREREREREREGEREREEGGGEMHNSALLSLSLSPLVNGSLLVKLMKSSKKKKKCKH